LPVITELVQAAQLKQFEI